MSDLIDVVEQFSSSCLRVAAVFLEAAPRYFW